MQRISVEEEFFNKSTPYLEYLQDGKTQLRILRTSYKKDSGCVRWMQAFYIGIAVYVVGFFVIYSTFSNRDTMSRVVAFFISTMIFGLPCLMFWRQARLITGISLQIRYRVQETLWLREDRIEDMYQHLQYMSTSSNGWYRASIYYRDIEKIEYNEYFKCFKLYAPVHIEFATSLLRQVENRGIFQNWTLFPYYNHTEELIQSISQRSGKPIVTVYNTSKDYTYDSAKPPPGVWVPPPNKQT